MRSKAQGWVALGAKHRNTFTPVNLDFVWLYSSRQTLLSLTADLLPACANSQTVLHKFAHDRSVQATCTHVLDMQMV